MAKDLKKVQLTGRLGADPEMRYTPQGSAVTTFRVACNRTWKDREGNTHDDTEWFRIVAWDKLAEICNQYLTKGSKVYIEGRLQTRKWTDQSGQERYTSEVITQDMIMLSGRNESAPMNQDNGYDEADEPTPIETAPAPSSSRAPARNATRGSAPSRSSRNAPQPIADDDEIPF